MVMRSAISVAAAVLVTLAMALLAAELLTRPLRELRTQAEALAAGDFSPREPIPSGGGEIAAISDAFVTMANRFGEQVHDLEQAREEGASHAEQLRAAGASIVFSDMGVLPALIRNLCAQHGATHTL